MSAKYDTPQFPPPADVSASNLVAKADAPPSWATKYQSVPLIGNYLNILSQAQSYFSVLESCVDFIAADLEKGLEASGLGREWVLRRRANPHEAEVDRKTLI
jgi:hypothetical protein